MTFEDGAEVGCPWCGEPLWVAVDPGGGATQRFVVDCEVCCRPIDVAARRGEDGALEVDAAPEGG